MKEKEGKLYNGKLFYCKDGAMARFSKYNIGMIMGGRYIGKSTDWQRFFIKEMIHGNKVGVVKATDRALAMWAKKYWSKSWMDEWFPEWELKYKSGKFFLRKKRDGQELNEGWKEVGYGFDLNHTMDTKSITEGQDLKWLLFEEFTNRKGKYNGNADNRLEEPEALMELYQSLARGQKGKATRDLKLVMISNLYSLNNPYFQYFKSIDMIMKNPNSIYQRFYTYDKGKLHYFIEFPQLRPVEEVMAADEKDEGIKFQDFRNELKYTNDRPNKVFLQLTYDGEYIINIAVYNKSIICFKGKKIIDSDECVAYSCSKYKGKDVFGIKMLKKTDWYDVIVSLYEQNNIYYDSLETFMNLTNILAF